MLSLLGALRNLKQAVRWMRVSVRVLTMEGMASAIITTLSRAGLYTARTYLSLHPPKCSEVC